MTVLAFDDTGGGRTALLLVHGFTLDRHLWDDVVPALAADIRVVCPDLRGFGESPPPIEGAPYTHADDLVALLDECGIDDVVIVGLSMGGWVALEFTLTYPARVRGLVLVDAMLREHPFPYGWNKNIGAVYRCGRQHGRDAAIALWLDDEIFAFERSRPDLAARLPALVARYEGFHLLHDDPHPRLHPPAVERLAEIAVPTLVIVGDHDLPDFHAMATTLSTNIAGAAHLVMPNAGHLAYLASPAEFVDLLRQFLQKVAAPH
ncbi:MAG TPA: alpha/beta fold hydrolase [Acidimicrobiales bacterium]|nr:alpha/beta fold hydrolase [Acidimicrobiales bacterium]